MHQDASREEVRHSRVQQYAASSEQSTGEQTEPQDLLLAQTANAASPEAPSVVCNPTLLGSPSSDFGYGITSSGSGGLQGRGTRLHL